MQPLLYISSDLDSRTKEIEKEISGLLKNSLSENPDYQFFASEETISIEDVRKITAFLSIKPYSEKNKVVYIKNAGQLTTEAQNAFLKTLEEPPTYGQIILGVDNESVLLPTVTSRCRLYFLTGLPANQTPLAEPGLVQLFRLKPIDRWLLLEKSGYSKDRESAHRWLASLALELHRFLSGQTPNNKVDQKEYNRLCWQSYEKAYNLINRAEKELTANCNVRLVLEVFLLDLPRLDC